MPDWLSDFLGNDKMLAKAERNLDRLLDETRDKRLVLDASKFVAERRGKEKWSGRTELTGKDGKDLPTPILGILTQNVPSNPRS